MGQPPPVQINCTGATPNGKEMNPRNEVSRVTTNYMHGVPSAEVGILAQGLDATRLETIFRFFDFADFCAG